MDGCSVERNSGALHPDARDQTDIVALQQPEDAVEESGSVEALARTSPGRVSADVGPLISGRTRSKGLADG